MEFSQKINLWKVDFGLWLDLDEACTEEISIVPERISFFFNIVIKLYIGDIIMGGGGNVRCVGQMSVSPSVHRPRLRTVIHSLCILKAER